MADSDSTEQLPSTESPTLEPETTPADQTTTPAVLNVNPDSPSLEPPPGEPRGATGGTLTATGSSREGQSESQRNAPQTIPGLTEMLSEWQISGVPEEQQFFSTSEGTVFEAALKAIKSHFGENDTVIKKAWLLTEIDHWDLEKERIIVLTNSNLVVVKFNFIQQMVEELKYIPLVSIKKISVGKFSYPYSYGFTRSGRGVKIWWGGNSPLAFSDKWNPFSSAVPHTILKSHILITRNQSTSPLLKYDDLPEILSQAVKEYHSNISTGSTIPDIPLVEEDIVFDHYIGLTALVHNQSFLGFFKKRGAINW